MQILLASAKIMREGFQCGGMTTTRPFLRISVRLTSTGSVVEAGHIDNSKKFNNTLHIFQNNQKIMISLRMQNKKN